MKLRFTGIVSAAAMYLMPFAACLLAGAFAASCADDDGVAAAYDGLAGHIGTRSPGDGGAAELIEDYRIYFVAEDGTIADVVDGRGTPAESQEFRATLNPGTYRAYGFGNIAPEYWTANYPAAVKGAPMPDLTDAVYSGPEDRKMANGYADGLPIPMSGRGQTVVVTGRENQNFAVEVERMLGALEISVRNEMSSDITVRKISFGPLTADGQAIYLMRNIGDDGAPRLPADVSATQRYEHDLGTAGVPVKKGMTAAGVASFYVMESDAKAHPTGRFVITVTLQRDGNAATEELRYALTEQIRYINRNDYIRIPLMLTDYVFDVPVWFYPPIGGYPPAEIEQKSDEEFYCTFRSGGDFIMRPRVRFSHKGEDEWIPLNDPAQVKGQPEIEVSGDDIYVSGGEPTVSSTGEIIGVLDNDKQGTSVVTFTVHIRNGADGTVVRDLVRKIYIIKT